MERLALLDELVHAVMEMPHDARGAPKGKGRLGT